jgi:hypothetical protein
MDYALEPPFVPSQQLLASVLRSFVKFRSFTIDGNAMAIKSWNILGLSALALLVCSFGSSPVSALSLDLSPNLHARHHGAHGLIAKKRGNERRCKPRPSSSSTPAAANTPAADNSPTPNNPAPSPSPTPQNTPTTPSSGAKAGLAWAAGDRPDILANFKTSHVATYLFCLL